MRKETKDTRLINIYLKIHNKKTLFLDDLRYLAKYAPDCFEKTCHNLVYNAPEAKPLMEPVVSQEPAYQETEKPQPTERQRIELVLDNLKYLEADDFLVADIDVNKVKNLLGSLYMELMFPHNDKDTFLEMAAEENTSSFDAKV